MCACFKTENENHSIGRSLNGKKLFMQNLAKEWKQPPAVILQQANFYNIFNPCLWLRIIRRSDQGV